MPTRFPAKPETVLPPLLIDIETHVHIPALPVPYPAWIGHLRICDVDGGGVERRVYPGGLVEFKVPERGGGKERDAEDEPAALVFIEDVDFGGRLSRGWWLRRGRGVG